MRTSLILRSIPLAALMGLLPLLVASGCESPETATSDSEEEPVAESSSALSSGWISLPYATCAAACTTSGPSPMGACSVPTAVCASGSCVRERQFTTTTYVVEPGGGSSLSPYGPSSPAGTHAYWGANGLALGDITGDGIPDAVVGDDYATPELQLYVGVGDGSFLVAGTINLTLTAPWPQAVAIADFDGDGRQDVAVATLVSIGAITGEIQIFKNNGGAFGTFPLAATLGAYSPRSLEVADFNGDGRPDFASADWTPAGNFLSVYQNTTPSGGLIGFSQAAIPTGGIQPYDLSTGDVNGDGRPDIVVANEASDSVTLLTNTGIYGSPMALAATLPMPATTPACNPISAKLVDYDGDSRLDIGVTCMNPAHAYIAYGAGGGVFAPFAAVPIVSGSSPSFAGMQAFDVDGDGIQDLTWNQLGSTTGYTYWIRQTTPRAYAATGAAIPGAVDGATRVATADLNGDGITDIASTGSGYGQLFGTLVSHASTALAAHCASSATPTICDGVSPPITPAGSASGLLAYSGVVSSASIYGTVSRDFNNDGTLDMVQLDSGGNLLFSAGTGSGTFGGTLTSATGGSPQNGTIAVGDFNNDCVLDIVFGDVASAYVTVAMGVGDGHFLAGHQVLGTPAAGTWLNGGSIVTADFNNDGWTDIASGDNISRGSLSILLNNGDGTGYGFATPVTGSTFTKPDPLHNRDASNHCTTLSGVFAMLMNLQAVDFNHDGNMDLAWREAATGGTPWVVNFIGVALGDGAGHFTTVEGECGHYGMSSRGERLVSADWDGDGFTDLIASEWLDSGSAAQTKRVVVYLGNPAATASTPVGSVLTSGGEITFTAPLNYDYGQSLQVADINNDGKGDVIMARNITGGNVVDVYYQVSGSFSASSMVSLATPALEAALGATEGGGLIAADYNRDGRVDVATTKGSSAGIGMMLNH
jgi:hypothetical protein